MLLIDTHNHIYLKEFDNDRDEVIQRTSDAGVKTILMPNIDSYSVNPMLAAEEKYPAMCLPMMGLHPTSVKDNYLAELDLIEKHLGTHRYFGIGETGIDLYWDKTWFREQVVCFRRHLEMAETMKLPVVIHARESLEVIFDVLTTFGPERVTGIFHAFPGSPDEAETAVNMGFMLGIGGVVTFRNSRLPETVLRAGIDNIVLETDAPYLAPAPHRGKRNESAYLHYVVAKLSEVFRISQEMIAEKTTINAQKLFNI